jgi:5-methylcytosine-specific restriction endonuclease McrBC regulatory subunit McrC
MVVNDNLRPFSHPYFTKYAALIKLCLSILRHERLAYGDNKDEKVYGVLIDAAWLWEEYIAGVVNEIGGNHYTKKKSKYKLFEDKGGEFQQIVPDYLYPGEEDGKNTWVADAKYIPLDEEQNKNMSADRAGDIYYKTIMYMYRFNTEKGFLLHPVRSDSENKVSLSTYNIPGGRGGKLHKVGICIPQSKDRYASFKKAIGKREKAFKETIEKLVGGNG